MRRIGRRRSPDGYHRMSWCLSFELLLPPVDLGSPTVEQFMPARGSGAIHWRISLAHFALFASHFLPLRIASDLIETEDDRAKT
jgi:hypothetical protein